jgi:peroxiredoxin (alkyl hydroperoxide reductase subunit C)
MNTEKNCDCDCHDLYVNFPRLNDPAPDFEAVTTHGTLRLSDFRDSWLILFSHPADFTPVCTTEFIAFAEIFPELQERNVNLIGLSVDSIYSHIAWIRNIEEKHGIKIPFPVIADLNKDVASAYGMVQPGASTTEAIRCVFVIDPKGTMRLMLYYPLTTGRNMQEILRIVDALQTSDENQVATPANWVPGESVIIPPPTTQQDAEARIDSGYECTDWYLCKKEL